MKRTTLFLASFILMLSAAFSQRISTMTVTGVPSCVPFAAFNPTNNSTTAIGDGQIIFPPTVDLSNVTVTFDCGTDASVTEPTTLPTDWTSTINGIKVTKTDNSSWAIYNVTAKKINPGTLPMEIKTGAGNFDSNSWTSATVGWAGACIDKNQVLIRFGSAKRSFMVAFDSAPDSLYYTIKALGTWTGSNNVFDVEGSADGINWTSIMQYNMANIMPPSTSNESAKIELNNQTFRFIRWIYSVRNAAPGNFNVSLENVKVTKKAASSVQQVLWNEIGAYISGNALIWKADQNIAEVSIHSLNGSLISKQSVSGQSLMLPHSMSRGAYLVTFKLQSGEIVSNKLIK